MLKGPFLEKNFIGAIDNFEESKIVMLGAPMEATLSNRPGTRFAPQSMRLESVGIETYSPTFNKNLEDVKFYDAGDLELPFGNPRGALDIIKENVEEIYKNGKKLLGIGGEHLVTLAEIEAIKEFYDNLAVLQFDAHTDLREEYLGEKLTHSGIMRQIGNITGFENIAQIGIRSGEDYEFELMKKYNTQVFKYDELERLKGKNVFLTIDLDCLDPSVMPGVGTPEAGGLTYKELINWLIEVKKLNIIGADIVELAPDLDPTKVSTATSCTLTREVLMLL